MLSEFEQASREYHRDVDRIAADLIRNGGMAPWAAMERAVQIHKNRKRAVRYTPGLKDLIDRMS